ncbi:MAG: amidohydrolase [Bacteroidota bacterium]
MPAEQLHITLIQPNIVWEDKVANLQQYEDTLAKIEGSKHIVVLPEMFSTGFSMAPDRLAEPMDGPTVVWMTNLAVKFRCILAGSVIIKDQGNYYNRFLWAQPDGRIAFYDKRHLFGYAGEDEHYTRGETRVIAQVNGWRINLQICYDLRFPVWARNQEDEYDVLLYVANWPEARSLAWKTLLQARAIENQCYVAGVNRVGSDAKGNNYIGESSVFGPLGELIWQHGKEPTCHTVTLEKSPLDEVRKKLPFLEDADKFLLL